MNATATTHRPPHAQALVHARSNLLPAIAALRAARELRTDADIEAAHAQLVDALGTVDLLLRQYT